MKLIACPHCGDTYPDFDVAHMCSRGPYAPQLKPRMNYLRIRQLAIEAGFYANPDVEKFEKFAELIVRECAELSVNSQYANTKSEYYEGFNEALIYAGNKILEHFGVEE